MCIETSKAIVAINEDRLVDLYRELMLEVRWRRDQESRFLTLYVSSLSIIAGGLFVILAKEPSPVNRENLLQFAILATLLLTGFTWIKIWSDHQKQKAAAEEVVWLWEHWHFIAPKKEVSEFPLPESARNFGTGFGWLISLGFATALGLSLIYFAYRLIHHC